MSSDFPCADPERFEAAIRRFDEENSRDPGVEMVDGVAHPREALYARRLTDWVLKLRPDASEELRLAARCQHLCRWKIPRDSYPMTRAGYLRWREALKQFHAQRAGDVLREVGLPGPHHSPGAEPELEEGFSERSGRPGIGGRPVPCLS